MSIANRRTRTVSQDCLQRHYILRWTPAHQIIRLERVCRACWEAATRDVCRQGRHDIDRPVLESVESGSIEDAVIPQPPPLPVQAPQVRHSWPIQTKINSLKYKRVSASSQHCLFIGCENIDRLLVPGISARICTYHLYSNRWAELQTLYSDFTGTQIDDIFTKLEKAAERHIDFNDISSIDSHLCHY